MSSPSPLSYSADSLKPSPHKPLRALSPVSTSRKSFSDLPPQTPLAPNFHAWRINVLTSTTLKQTDFLLRAQKDLSTASTPIVRAALKVLDDNHIAIPDKLFHKDVEKEPNFMYEGLLILLHVSVSNLNDDDWIDLCKKYLAEFPTLLVDLLDAFGICQTQKENQIVNGEAIISPDALFLAATTSNTSTSTGIGFDDKLLYPVGESPPESTGSNGSGDADYRRTRLVTFQDSPNDDVSASDQSASIQIVTTSSLDAHVSNTTTNGDVGTVNDLKLHQQHISVQSFDGNVEGLFQQDSTELLLTGQRIVYDLHVAMKDRPGETKDLVKRHEDFFNRIRSCLSTPGKREEFDKLLFEPREKYDDLAWIRAISSLVDSAPALLAHFKEIVGYDHHDSEGIEFDDDEDDYYYKDDLDYDEQSDDDDDIHSEGFKALSSAHGGSPPPPKIEVVEVLEDNSEVPSSDLPVDYFGVWDRIFMHLRDNPAIVKGLEKDYPQFFVNLRTAMSTQQRQQPSALSLGGGPINLENHPPSPLSGLGVSGILNQQGPALGNINWESVEYQRFRNILVADRSTVTDDEWLEEVHAVLGTKRNLLDQFKEIVAYELEVDEDEINRFDQEQISEDEEEPLSLQQQPSHSRKTPSSYIYVPARTEFMGMAASEIEKKYPQFFAQLHVHLRQHGHPPRAFSRFMRILRAPREFIADDKWLGLLTHSFLGGSRKLRKNFRTLIQASVDRDGIPGDVDSDDEEWSGEYVVEFRNVTDIPASIEDDETQLTAAIDAAQLKIDALVTEIVEKHSGVFGEIKRLLNPPEDPKASKRPATSVDAYTLLQDHLRVLRRHVHDTAFVVRVEEIMGMGGTEVYAPNGLYSRLADILGIRQLSVHTSDEFVKFSSDTLEGVASPPPPPQKQVQSVREQLPEVLPALEAYVLIRQALGDDKVFAKVLHEFIDLRERERQQQQQSVVPTMMVTTASAESLNTTGTSSTVGSAAASVEVNKPMKLSEVVRVLIKDVAGAESEAMRRFDGLVSGGGLDPAIDAALGLGAGQKMMASYVSMFGDNTGPQ